RPPVDPAADGQSVLGLEVADREGGGLVVPAVDVAVEPTVLAHPGLEVAHLAALAAAGEQCLARADLLGLRRGPGHRNQALPGALVQHAGHLPADLLLELADAGRGALVVGAGGVAAEV